eukprot:8491612-Prorocentrum_lima.AAC.1
MTSSLVGSEMCIRDSGGGDGGGGGGGGGDVGGGGGGERVVAVVLPCAVSYTHLTLPTICSV